MKIMVCKIFRGLRHGWAVGMMLAVAACADPSAMHDGSGHLGQDFGNAVSHNAAQHVLDPAPFSRSVEAPPMDGARAGAAIRRYREGAVIPPEEVETSTFGELR